MVVNIFTRRVSKGLPFVVVLLLLDCFTGIGATPAFVSLPWKDMPILLPQQKIFVDRENRDTKSITKSMKIDFNKICKEKYYVRKTSLLNMGFFRGLFGEDVSSKPKRISKAQQQKDLMERMELKRSIVLACDDPNVYRRSDIEVIMSKLAALSPVQDTATSSLLQKKWIVLWTTEKEINFFLDNKIATIVSQTISGETIVNEIPFGERKKKDDTTSSKGFFVTGTLRVPPIEEQPQKSTILTTSSSSISDDSSKDEQLQKNYIRTEFTFVSATIDFGLIRFNVPPVGKGWFDTIYLDEDFRMDTNSRNDILIAFSAPTE